MNAETPSIYLLKYFLKEMFQFNANDLDFGIYKIYNLKRKEIEDFIDGAEEQCLEPTINRTLQDVSNLEKKVEQQALFAFLKESNKEGFLADTTANFEKIQSLIDLLGADEAQKKSLSDALKSSTQQFNITDELKDKIYNHILGFFEMYYCNGDFGYNNRSRSLYKVPYEADYDGNDTMFHWKHKGSLYIKTGNAFNAIKFKLNHLGKEFELRLETNEDSENEEVAQNNNKDTQLKHYKFNRFEDVGGVTRIVFNLSSSSTTKADLFKALFKDVFNSQEVLDKYLFAKNDKEELKPIFNDLKDDFDKVQDGSVKGIGALRLNRKTVLDKVNKNFPAGSKVEIDKINSQERFSDETLETLYNIDQKLNSFYIGNDSDYFIHEDLHSFLTQEKERFIKNYILGDLSAILNGKLDNTTLIIAKAFNDVTDRIIEFLSAIEEFQKKLFTMKKKIVECEYCITINNINEQHYPEILDNQAQLSDWDNLFSVKVKTIEDLKSQPTLVLDTKFFKQPDGSNAFKDKVLAEIDLLDEKTNGLLINSENYQALNFVKEKYKNTINTIYIDPPYNTGSDGFQYKDYFQHSSWVSMIQNRMEIAKQLLNESGAVFVQIDYKELNHLRSCLSSIFEDKNFIQLISIKTSTPAGFKVVNPGPVSVTEFVLMYTKNKNKYNFKKGYVEAPYQSDYKFIIDNPHEHYSKWNILDIKDKALNSLKVVSEKDLESKVGKGIAKIVLQKEIERLALENASSVFATYGPHKPSGVLKELIEKSKGSPNEIIYHQRDDASPFILKAGRLFAFYDKKIQIIDGCQVPTQLLTDFWSDLSWDSLSFEGGVTFKNGKKPEKLIRRILEISTEENDFVLDFFAGSGSTCAVAQKTNRKWIGAEVGRYFDDVLKRRIINVFNGESGGVGKDKSNRPLKFFKYLVLEQYEDVLDGIEKFDGETPKNLPLKYLYKPELNKLESSLDLSKPFSNQVKYGQPTKVGYVDLVETYNYLQGYEIKTIKTYNIKNKYYKAVETSDGTLVVWRDIALAEDDSEAVKTIIGHYPDTNRVDINFYFNILATLKDKQLPVGDRVLDLTIIHAQVFSE